MNCCWHLGLERTMHKALEVKTKLILFIDIKCSAQKECEIVSTKTNPGSSHFHLANNSGYTNAQHKRSRKLHRQRLILVSLIRTMHMLNAIKC